MAGAPSALSPAAAASRLPSDDIETVQHLITITLFHSGLADNVLIVTLHSMFHKQIQVPVSGEKKLKNLYQTRGASTAVQNHALYNSSVI